LGAARGAADAEVDAAGVEGFEQAELLGDLQRAVMRKHDAARADAQMTRLGCDARHHDFGRTAGETGRAVVLGEPIAVIPEAVDVARQLDGFEQHIVRGHTLPHW
jgi:hypothetical protein